jgi:hypothetical protein
MSPLRSSNSLNSGYLLDLYRSRQLGANINIGDADKPYSGVIEPNLYILSRDQSGDYWVNILKTDGTILGRIATGYSGTTCQVSLTIMYPYLIICTVGSGSVKVIDISNLSGGDIYGADVVTRSFADSMTFAPFGGNELIKIRSTTAHILDFVTGVLRTLPVGNVSYSSMAQVQPTVGFANHGTEWAGSLSNRYLFAGGSSSPGPGGSYPYPQYLYSVSNLAASPTANATMVKFVDTNYSRSGGFMMSSTKAIIHTGGGYHQLFTEGTTNPTSIDLTQGLSYGSATYSSHTDDATGNPCIGVTDTKLFKLYKYGTSTYDYSYRVGYLDINPSFDAVPKDLGIPISNQSNTSSGRYYNPHSGISFDRINEQGFMAITYFDAVTYGRGTSKIMIKIVDDSGTIVKTYGPIDLGSAYCAGNSDSVNFNISPESRFTNVLYKSNRYEPF